MKALNRPMITQEVKNHFRCIAGTLKKMNNEYYLIFLDYLILSSYWVFFLQNNTVRILRIKSIKTQNRRKIQVMVSWSVNFVDSTEILVKFVHPIINVDISWCPEKMRACWKWKNVGHLREPETKECGQASLSVLT